MMLVRRDLILFRLFLKAFLCWKQSILRVSANQAMARRRKVWWNKSMRRWQGQMGEKGFLPDVFEYRSVSLKGMRAPTRGSTAHRSTPAPTGTAASPLPVLIV